MVLHDPGQKKLRQPRAAGAQACALSSMHAPIVWLAWLSQFFLARVIVWYPTDINCSHCYYRQAAAELMHRRRLAKQNVAMKKIKMPTYSAVDSLVSGKVSLVLISAILTWIAKARVKQYQKILPCTCTINVL